MIERRDIAIVGMACRFPGAANVEEFWANLLDGRDTITRLQDEKRIQETFVAAVGKLTGTDLFDAEYFKIPPSEASLMDPQQRLLLEVAVSAMEDAGYGGEGSIGQAEPTVGVFVGGGGENEYLHDFAAPASGRNPFDDLRLRTGNGTDFLAARIAFELGFTGPSITVQAGCATGLVALATACNALIMGDCDVALVGGVSLVMPDVTGYDYESGGILSRDGYCRPFDSASSGTVPSSGVGIVVLKLDDDALRDGDSRRAVVRGWAVNNDGGSRSGFTVPNVDGQARVIQSALDRAGVAAAEIGFLETHGTATAVGDAVEIEALKQVFGKAENGELCNLGATKANIGHTDAAAGIAGLIKAVLVVEQGLIPPLANFTKLNGSLDFIGTPFTVPTKAEQWTRPSTRFAGVSSFAMGGNNAHVVISDVPRHEGESPKTARLIALSARSPEQLDRLRASAGTWFSNAAPLSAAGLADAAFTLAVGRRHYEHRWAAVADDAQTVARLLGTVARPIQRVPRYELLVDGTVAELFALGQGDIAALPPYQTAATRLRGELNQTGALLSDIETAALTVLAIIHTFRDLGLEFARVDGPMWVRPALEWQMSREPGSDSLAKALHACEASVKSAGSTRIAANEALGGKPVSSGLVLVDASFSFLATIALLWEGGAAVNLGDLYRGEVRQRIPMPTYPFAQREHWVQRYAMPSASGAPSKIEFEDGSLDVAGTVANIWRDVLGIDELDPDAHFIDELGGDSMYAVEIGGRLNEEFGLELPIDLPFEAPTLNKAVAAVTSALNAGRTDK